MILDSTDDPDRQERRNEVFLAFVEAIEEGRDSDRQRLLADHPDLRPDLEAFLAGHDVVSRLTAPLRAARRQPEPLLPALPRIPRSEPAPGLGELGDFRLVREVARGGMGVVYEAEQISLRRRVALKVLPFVAAIDPRRLQRFKTEALAAAVLQHENIVPVHAVGCERGVHYYAMQFIEGQSLATLIECLRSDLGAPQDDSPADRDPADRGPEPPPSGDATAVVLTISRERVARRREYIDRMVRLVRQAALALEHAHQAEIVHRDVKPGNLLLDLRGQLWITDFGLAQVTGDAGLTMTGEMLGTLRSASPEQVLARRGIVDHRSDIYALGATLYELLTLRPPFDGRDRTALIRQIVEDEPVSPRSLEPSLPIELETIVLKTLRKEPVDRYATGQELADDLQRFLDGQPIVARPPTVTERLRSWTRRHPGLMATGVLALMLVSAGSILSAALVRREQARTLIEQRKAEAAYQREHQRAEEAEVRLRLARRAVDELIRTSEEELAHRPGMEGLRKRLLSSAADYYREFIEQRRNDPDAQAELRDTTRRVETILADLAVLRAAGELYLLAQPTAHDDLQLDETQRRKVAGLSSRAGRRWMRTFGDPDHPPAPAERARIALEMARANEAEVDAILTPAQRLRLRQIALRAEGPAAFREPEVIEALRLTSDQREQIRVIEEEALLRQFRDLRSGKGADEASAAAMNRVLGLLTSEQVKSWNTLTGAPLQGPLSVFPRPFRPARNAR